MLEDLEDFVIDSHRHDLVVIGAQADGCGSVCFGYWAALSVGIDEELGVAIRREL